MLYYGTEAGMWGGDDPDDRQPMVWPGARYDDQAADPLGRPRKSDKVAFDNELFSFYRALFKLRADHAALRRGDLDVTLADDRAGVVVLRRGAPGETAWAVFNRGDAEWTGDIPVGPEEAGHVAEVFTASGESMRVRVERRGEKVRVTLPGRDAVVLSRREATLAKDE